MATRGKSWLDTQQKRLDSEQRLTAVLAGLTLVPPISNRVLIPVGLMLFFANHFRSRVVNTEDREWAQRRLFLSNPIIELLSIIIVIYSIAVVVRQFSPTTTLLGNVSVYIGLCALVTVVHLGVERFSTGEYFEWWGERALDREKEDDEGWWTYAAYWAKRLSAVEPSKKEIRSARSRQRKIPGKYTPLSTQYDPPAFEWSWLGTIFNWLVTPGRGLSFIVGLAFLDESGFGFWSAIVLTGAVILFSSILADHIKYYYYFRPLREGHQEEPKEDTWKNRLVQIARCYWVSTLVAFGILWLVF